MSVERHAFHDIGIENVAIDVVTKLPHVYRVTTIDMGKLCSFIDNPFETAINTVPVERYSKRADAIAGHKRYVKLLNAGWYPGVVHGRRK